MLVLIDRSGHRSGCCMKYECATTRTIAVIAPATNNARRLRFHRSSSAMIVMKKIHRKPTGRSEPAIKVSNTQDVVAAAAVTATANAANDAHMKKMSVRGTRSEVAILDARE